MSSLSLWFWVMVYVLVARMSRPHVNTHGLARCTMQLICTAAGTTLSYGMSMQCGMVSVRGRVPFENIRLGAYCNFVI